MAEATEEMGNWVLWIFIFVLLIGVVGLLYVILTSMSDIERCRLSVIAKAKTSVAGIESGLNLDCKTRDITIKEDGTYIGRKKIEKYSGNLERSIKKTIADEMAICWYQFLEGTQNPFGEFRAGHRCVLCSEIRFDTSVKSKYSEVDGLIDFLNEAEYKQGLHYSDYLFGEKMDTTNIAQNIITDQEYGITFIMVKKEDWGRTLGWIGGGALAGCIGGAVAGIGIGSIPGCAVGAVLGIAGEGILAYFHDVETELYPYVFFIPIEQVKDECNRLG